MDIPRGFIALAINSMIHDYHRHSSAAAAGVRHGATKMYITINGG